MLPLLTENKKYRLHVYDMERGCIHVGLSFFSKVSLLRVIRKGNNKFSYSPCICQCNFEMLNNLVSKLNPSPANMRRWANVGLLLAQRPRLG